MAIPVLSPSRAQISLPVKGLLVTLSTDNGTSWTVVNNGLPNDAIGSLAVSGTNIFAGTLNNGVFRSTNNGANWTQAGLTSTCINAFAVSGTNLFAGTFNGVFLSTDNGTSWTAASNGVTGYIYAFAVSGTNLFTAAGGVFLSTDNGTSWTGVNTGLTNTDVRSLGASGTNLFAGVAGGGAFRSTNNGTSWTEANQGLPRHPFIPTEYAFINCFVWSGQNLFAGLDGGVYLSTDNGTNWTNASNGLPNNNLISVPSLVVLGTNLFATTSGFPLEVGVWQRPLSDMVTSVPAEGESGSMPSQFVLDQNYPNPFNPSTKITYTLPERGNVSLKVFDLLGGEVAQLVNGEIEAGSYDISFNAANLPSGIYFYRFKQVHL